MKTKSLFCAWWIGLSTAAADNSKIDFSEVFSRNGSFELAKDTHIVFTDPAPHLGRPSSISDIIDGWRMHRQIHSTGRPRGSPLWIRSGLAQDGDHYVSVRDWNGADPWSSQITLRPEEFLPDGQLRPSALIVGERYELSFWASGGDNFLYNGISVNLGFEGSSERIQYRAPLMRGERGVDGQSGALFWTYHTIEFVAASESMSLTLASRVFIPPNGVTAPQYGSTANYDNFRLRAIPEPGSAFLAVAGFSLIVLAHRRRI